MANMSYCIIENTAKDLEEAALKIRVCLEGGDGDRPKKLSVSEYRYLHDLIEWAQEVVDLNAEHDLTELKP